MNEQKLLRKKRKTLLDGNKLLFASICVDLGDLYVKEGKYEEAIDQYADLAEAYKSLGKYIENAKANRMIGEAYMHLNQFDKALEFQNFYLKTAKEEKDRLEEQRALATIGHTYLTSYLNDPENNVKELDIAFKMLMKSLVVCESLTGISKYEHMDMSARLFANLGVIHECKENFDKGIELVEKSIKICKNHDLYDQLERSYIQLGSLYFRKKEYDKAISHYNLAIEVAGCLPDKISRVVASLIFKSEVLITLSDFRSAKDVLLKAYKMKSPNVIDKETVEHNLKIVAAMCYTEDTLLTTSENDYKTRKSLYEKMGDGACELKAYNLGIEYYEKMLEAAVKLGEEGKALVPCYVSLAQTYKDNKNYESSLKYFEKELNIYRDTVEDVKEIVATLINIAETMELAGKNVYEIETIYRKAYERSNKEDKLKSRVLSRHVGFLRKNKMDLDADELEKKLFELNYIENESDSESSSDVVETTPNIGDDICLSDITDVSDTSDSETNVDKSRPRSSTRNKTKSFVVKKNNKGETQLHTACINGNAELAKKLVQQKHPVNIRDNCGWLPIHEASLHGHLDVVRVLVENGAAINDRGGTGCGGTTPLHDASINGHLRIVEFLLDNGASSIAKDDKGDTPLVLLKQWRSTEILDEDSQLFYDNLIKRMSKYLEKSGRTEKNPQHSCSSRSFSVYDNVSTINTTTTTTTTVNKSEIVGKLRKSSSFNDDDLFDHFPSTSRSSSCILNDENLDETITTEYKQVMNNLRHRSQTLDGGKKRKSNEDVKVSTHLTVEDVDELNWLEDDLKTISNKKRKTTLNDNIFNYNLGSLKNKESFTRKNSSTSLKSDKSGNVQESMNFKDNYNYGDDDIMDILEDSSNSSVENLRVKTSKKSQSSLIDSGFHRSKKKWKNRQVKLTDWTVESRVSEADSTTENQGRELQRNNSLINDPVLSVDVRIDGKLYRVPIMLSEVNAKTVKWLADEASKRYARKEFVRPILDLETKNGAVLADDDFVSILFPAGSVQSEEVQAKIIKWDIPTLIERYQECCQNLNEQVLDVLRVVSSMLDLSNLGLDESQLVPISKALNRQTNLYTLNLSGSFFTKETMSNLCHSLPSLININILNLSSCNIDCDMLEIFSDLFTNQKLLENLTSLDLSFNPLTDLSLKYLQVLSKNLKLENLNLTNVDFTGDIFQHFSNRNVELFLKNIKQFNISYNDLKTEQIGRILTWLEPTILENVNLSNNYSYSSGIVKELQNFLANNVLKLKNLNLSRSNVTDNEIESLLSCFEYSPGLETIDISYNLQLTTQSTKNLLKHCSLKCLNLTGCEKTFLNLSNDHHQLLHLLKDSFVNNLSLTVSSQDSELVMNIWKEKYGEIGRLVNLIKYLQLSVKK